MNAVRFSLKGNIFFWVILSLLIGNSALAQRNYADLDIQTEIFEFNRKIAETDQDLFNDKIEAMSQDLFAFLRGTAHIMNKDMQQSEKLALLRTSPTGMIAGDLHMHNYSIIRSNAQPAAYAIDDLDEAFAEAPLAFDIFRLAVSMLAGFNKLAVSYQPQLVRKIISGYQKRASDQKISEWPAIPDSEFIKEFIEDESDTKWAKFIKKRTLNETPNRFDLQRFEPVSASEKMQISSALSIYLAGIASMPAEVSQISDIAQRFDKGLSSIGLRRFFALLRGLSDSCEDDLIIEIKEMRPSSVAACDITRQREVTIEALRRAHQAFDPFLGTVEIASGSYLVRQIYPWSETIESTAVSDPSQIFELAEALGFICADFHAASGRGQQMVVWLESSADKLIPLVEEYQKQLEQDFLKLLGGKKSE